MGTTLAAIRQKLAERGNWWLSAATTSAGGAAGATLISTQLLRYDRAANDWYNKMWVLISDTSSNSSGDERMVLDYSTTTGTITPYAAFTAQVETAKNFEVHPYQPTLIRAAINDAGIRVYPKIAVPCVDESIVGGSWLPNSSFDDWAATSIPDHYTSSNVTVTKETLAAYTWGPKGSFSMKLTAGAAGGYVSCSGQQWPMLYDLAGQTVTFKSWAYCGTANKARIGIYMCESDNTSTTTYSSYHTGNAFFEQLSVTVTLPLDLADIWFCFYHTADTAYFDRAQVFADSQPPRYHLPSAFLYRDPDTVYVGGDADDIDEIPETSPRFDSRIIDDGTDKYIQFAHGLSSEQKVRLVGRKPLSAATADTDNIEVTGMHVVPLVSEALAEMFRRLASTPTSDDKTEFKSAATYWEGVAADDLRKYSMRFPSSVVKGLY